MSEEVHVDGVHMHLENKKISRNFFWMIWLMYAVVCMTKNCYSGAMAAIVSEGVLTKSQTGLISAMFYGVYAPLQIVGGIFADKYNPEKMIKIGLIGSAIANAVIFFNQQYYVMLAVWTFNAIVQFALWPSVFKIISSQLDSAYRIKGIYYITLSNTFGLVFSYLIAALVTRWQYNFLISSASLIVLAVVFHVACKQVEKYMVPDVTPKIQPKGSEVSATDISTWKLFLKSGFICLIVVNGLRTIVSNSVTTLSATILMESYNAISPSIGNLLNIIIIFAGVLGTFLVNQYVYPRWIKHEVIASFVLGFVAILPTLVMSFVGAIPVIVFLFALCAVSLILTGAGLIMSRCSAAFSKYGKNGVASGVTNSLTATAYMIQNYAIVRVADSAGWKAVIYLWIVLLAVAGIFLVIALPLWSRFKKNKI